MMQISAVIHSSSASGADRTFHHEAVFKVGNDGDTLLGMVDALSIAERLKPERAAAYERT